MKSLMTKIKGDASKKAAFVGIAAILTFVTFSAAKGILPENMLAVGTLSPEQQTQTVVASVGALMVLPTDDTPAIFNVSDSASLKAQQGFFQNTQDGDVLLVYSKSQKAIIYSPEKNMIVNVGPITFDDTATPTEN